MAPVSLFACITLMTAVACGRKDRLSSAAPACPCAHSTRTGRDFWGARRRGGSQQRRRADEAVDTDADDGVV